MQLNVPFSEIPEQGIEGEIKDSQWFPDDQMEQAGPAAVHIRLAKKNDNRVELRGSLKAAVFLACDRCLKRFVLQIDSPMLLLVEVSQTNEHWRVQDIEVAEGDFEIVSQDKPVVDLVDILRQQLFLCLPEKILCTEKCLGLCTKCGEDLNEGDCGCTRQTANSPFAVLEALKKKN